MTRIRMTTCLTCRREVEYRTKRPMFCRRCYGSRRYARAIGRDTSAPLVQTGFQPGNVPWNRGLGLNDPRVATYAAKLRLISDRSSSETTRDGNRSHSEPGTERSGVTGSASTEYRVPSTEFLAASDSRPNSRAIEQPAQSGTSASVPTSIRRERRAHCRLCGTVRAVGTHYLDLNPRNTSRQNQLPLCATCRGAVILLIGRDPDLLTRLLMPAGNETARRAA